jgi:hypothetical protein
MYLRRDLGRKAREMDKAYASSRVAHDIFQKMPQVERDDFTNRQEKGLPQESEALQKISDAMLAVSRQDLVEFQKHGKLLENFRENYVGHVWKKLPAEEANGKMRPIIGAKRPFEGDKRQFMKRVFESTQDGLDFGMEHQFPNPVDRWLFKHEQAQRYIMAHNNLQTQKELGYSKFVPSGKEPPSGYVVPEDKMFTVWDREEGVSGPILRGRYFMHPDLARLYDNLLAPGLSGNMLYKLYRGANNAMTRFQLLGLFHLGLVQMDSLGGAAALAALQASRGELGAAAKSIALAPYAPVQNIINGRKMLKAMYSDDKLPDDPLMRKMRDLLIDANMINLNSEYENHLWEKMKDYWAEQKPVWAALTGVAAVPEVLTRPLFKYIVPWQKAGAFMRFVQYELERNPNMSYEQSLKMVQRVSDTIENAMGQVVYDNRFLHTANKQMQQATLRAVGWTEGKWRMFLGSMKDLYSVGMRGHTSNDEKVYSPDEEQGMTYRMAYLLGMLGSVSFLGVIANRLLSGSKFSEMSSKDLLHPRTGRLDKYGRPERFDFPSQVKDIPSSWHGLGQSLINALGPQNALVFQIMNNRDYFGTEVRNEDDSVPNQIKDVALFGLKQFTPFGVQKAMQQSVTPKGISKGELSEDTRNAVLKIAPLIGFQQSRRDVNMTPAELAADEISASKREVGARTKEQAKQSNDLRELRNDFLAGRQDVLAKIAARIKDGTMTEKDLDKITDPRQTGGLLWQMRQFTPEQYLKVLKVASDDEKAALREPFQNKILSQLDGGSLSPARFKQILPEARKIYPDLFSSRR